MPRGIPDHALEQFEAVLTDALIRAGLNEMSAVEVNREYDVDDEGGLRIRVYGIANLPVERIEISVASVAPSPRPR